MLHLAPQVHVTQPMAITARFCLRSILKVAFSVCLGGIAENEDEEEDDAKVDEVDLLALSHELLELFSFR